MANLNFVFVPLAATLLLAFALPTGKLSLVIILIHVRSQEQEQRAEIAADHKLCMSIVIQCMITRTGTKCSNSHTNRIQLDYKSSS